MLNKDKNICVGVYWNGICDLDKTCQNDWMAHSAQQKDKWRPHKERWSSMPLPLRHVRISLHTSLYGVM